MSSKRFFIYFLCAAVFMGIVYTALPKNTKLSITYVLEDLTQPSETLLLGSSTITRFPTRGLQHCKTPKVRGFSNGHASDVLHYLRWRKIDEPKNVFIYVGENDIAHGKSVQTAVQDLSEIIAYFDKYPQTTVGILLIKPSPVRERFHSAYADFNQIVARQYQDTDNVHFIEMNKFNSQAYYMRDGIHFTRLAYDRLSSEIDSVCQKSGSL